MTNADIIRRLRAEAALRGDCYVCRCRPAKPGRRTCQSCLDSHYERKQAQMARRRRARRCPTCGEKPPRGRVLCAACADHDRTRTVSAVARGLCIRCWRSRGADGTKMYCRDCADKCSAEAKARRVAKVAAGLCCRDGCGALLESQTLCFGHLLALRRAGRERTAMRRAA